MCYFCAKLTNEFLVFELLLKIMTTKIKAYFTLIEVVLLTVVAKLHLFEFTENYKNLKSLTFLENSNANSLVL